MKTLIASCYDGNQGVKNAPRFQSMIPALHAGGITACYHNIQSLTQLLYVLQVERPDIVFSSADHIPGDANEDCSIHAVLEQQGIPWIGSSADTLELVLSKSDIKKKWEAQNIPTPAYFLARRAEKPEPGLEQGYPYILKPNREGNSRGLSEDSIAFNPTDLSSRLDDLLETYEEVLVEQYLGMDPHIREFTVALIGNGAHTLLMPAEITLKHNKKVRVITTQDKDDHHTLAVPVEEGDLREELITLSQKAFEAAGVRDYSRCDILMSGGKFFVIEINGQPMVPDRWFEACAQGVGLNECQYINAIFLAGIVRNMGQPGQALSIPPEMKQLLPASVLDQLLKSEE